MADNLKDEGVLDSGDEEESFLGVAHEDSLEDTTENLSDHTKRITKGLDILKSGLEKLSGIDNEYVESVQALNVSKSLLGELEPKPDHDSISAFTSAKTQVVEETRTVKITRTNLLKHIEQIQKRIRHAENEICAQLKEALKAISVRQWSEQNEDFYSSLTKISADFEDKVSETKQIILLETSLSDKRKQALNQISKAVHLCVQNHSQPTKFIKPLPTFTFSDPSFLEGEQEQSKVKGKANSLTFTNDFPNPSQLDYLGARQKLQGTNNNTTATKLPKEPGNEGLAATNLPKEPGNTPTPKPPENHKSKPNYPPKMDAYKGLPFFSGKPGESASSHMMTLNDYFNCHKVDKTDYDEMQTRFAMSLKEKARIWFQQNEIKPKKKNPDDPACTEFEKITKDQWEKLLEKFTNRFSDIGTTEWEKHQAWQELKLKDKEAVEDYVDRINYLKHILEKRDLEANMAFHKGLPIEIQSQVLVEDDLDKMIAKTKQILFFRQQQSKSTERSSFFEEASAEFAEPIMFAAEANANRGRGQQRGSFRGYNNRGPRGSGRGFRGNRGQGFRGRGRGQNNTGDRVQASSMTDDHWTQCIAQNKCPVHPNSTTHSYNDCRVVKALIRKQLREDEEARTEKPKQQEN